MKIEILKTLPLSVDRDLTTSPVDDLYEVLRQAEADGVRSLALPMPEKPSVALRIANRFLYEEADSLCFIYIICPESAAYEKLRTLAAAMFGRGLTRYDRIRGCILGGAVGDALGYPVEFLQGSQAQVRDLKLRHGVAEISDDTQMTLFTACGMMYAHTRGILKDRQPSFSTCIAAAYQNWYDTQTYRETSPCPQISWISDIKALHDNRAPGTTCMTALEAGGASLRRPLNNSKGCGGVMRIAPIPLYGAAHRLLDQRQTATVCAEAAAVTHGHPLGWLSSLALGLLLYDAMQNFSLDFALEDTIHILESHYDNYPAAAELAGLLKSTRDLAAGPVSRLGAGWVGEEALAIGLACVLDGTDKGFKYTLLKSVSHDGDSDSTGSIAGQLYGAFFGSEAIPQEWLDHLELKDTLEELIQDLYNGCPLRSDSSYKDPVWSEKYVSGHKPSEEEASYRSLWVSADPAAHKNFVRHDGTPVFNISLQQDILYQAAPTVEGAVFGSDDPEEHPRTAENGTYYMKHGKVRFSDTGEIDGVFRGEPFHLVPDHTGRCYHIMADFEKNPWIGSIRPASEEWKDPYQIEVLERAAWLLPVLSLIVMDDRFKIG